MDKQHSSRRIRNFLILGEFQLRWAGYMVLVSSVLTAVLGWLVFHFNQEASRVVNVRVLDPTDAEAQALAQVFRREQLQLVAGLIAFGVLTAVVLAVWQIVSTHKVAGPLHYIEAEARKVRDGRLGTLRPLRDGDLLHGFFETFREMQQSLRERAERDAAELARLASVAQQAGQTELAADLRALQREREEAIK